MDYLPENKISNLKPIYIEHQDLAEFSEVTIHSLPPFKSVAKQAVQANSSQSEQPVKAQIANAANIVKLLRLSCGANDSSSSACKTAKETLRKRVEIGILGNGQALEELVARLPDTKLFGFNSDRILNYACNFVYFRQHQNRTISWLCGSGLQILSMGREQLKLIKEVADCSTCTAKLGELYNQ